MATSECETCGGEFHWDWTEAFSKFGFNDGDGQVETWQVESILTEAGYTVDVDGWGLHNTVIISIKKQGIEKIPYDNSEYTFGYDDPRRYFPEELVSLLDTQLPPSDAHQLLW